MASFDSLLGVRREWLASLAVEALPQGMPTREQTDAWLAALRVHLCWAELRLQPWVARVEGPACASRQSELLLTMRELMAELESLPGRGLAWQAVLLALEDTAVAHLCLMRQLFARWDEAPGVAALLRYLSVTREGLWLRMRRDCLNGLMLFSAFWRHLRYPLHHFRYVTHHTCSCYVIFLLRIIMVDCSEYSIVQIMLAGLADMLLVFPTLLPISLTVSVDQDLVVARLDAFTLHNRGWTA